MASARFAGTVTNNGVPVEGVVTVATTTTPTAVSGTLSVTGRFSVSVAVATGDTVTLTVDIGQKFTATTIVGGSIISNRVIDLSCDLGPGSIALPVFC